jgi:hypothetical protein
MTDTRRSSTSPCPSRDRLNHSATETHCPPDNALHPLSRRVVSIRASRREYRHGTSSRPRSLQLLRQVFLVALLSVGQRINIKRISLNNSNNRDYRVEGAVLRVEIRETSTDSCHCRVSDGLVSEALRSKFSEMYS